MPCIVTLPGNIYVCLIKALDVMGELITFVDTVHSQSKKFVTGVKIKVVGASNLQQPRYPMP